jgi:hypothetical protein
MKVELRSHDATVGVVRSPVIFLDFPEGKRRPITPLHLGWTAVLSAPILYEPDGAFQAEPVRALLRPSGRLTGEVVALERLVAGPRPVALDLVVSPTLVDQLRRLSSGYTEIDSGTRREIPQGAGEAAVAGGLLARLRGIAASPRVELAAFPLSAPEIPALVHSGLEEDLTTQLHDGAALVSDELGAAVSSTVFAPPGSALDQASVYALSALGVGVFVLDPSLVVRPAQQKQFAQPAVAALSLGLGASVTAVVSDYGVQGLLESPQLAGNPTLLAQAVIGELAQIWLEQPAVLRSIALTLPEASPLPGRLFGPLVSRLAGAPWMERESLTRLVREFPPAPEPAELTPRLGRGLPGSYVRGILDVRSRAETYRSMLDAPSSIPGRLIAATYVAESGDFAGGPDAGARFLETAAGTLRRLLSAIGLGGSPAAVTLASQSGGIPVILSNAADAPLKVEVTLLSSHLQFLPGQDHQTVSIGAGATVPLTFRARARTTGTFPARIVVAAPTGTTLGVRAITIRSKAYNVVALVITIGAAAFLLLWWARRLLLRPRT